METKKDWLEYFEAINGRKPSPQEFVAAKKAGEFSDEPEKPAAETAEKTEEKPAEPSQTVENTYQQGMEQYRAKNYEQALATLKLAAGGGHTQALFRVGYMLTQGQGVKVDDGQAIPYYEQAAAKGDIVSAYNLGALYARAEEWEKSFFWYQKSAELGDWDAKRNVAVCYTKGRGVEQDKKKAESLYKQIIEKCPDEKIKKEVAGLLADLPNVKDKVNLNFALAAGLPESWTIEPPVALVHRKVRSL